MSSELFRIADTLSLDSDTVALSARQGKVLNEKILALTGLGEGEGTTITVTDGLVPLGGIVPVAGVFSGPKNSGVFKTALNPVSGQVTTNGYQWCDGAKVADGAIGSFLGSYVPDLTDNRYLRGSITSGFISTVSEDGVNKGDNTVQLSITQMPSHNHVITSSSAQGGAISGASFSGTTTTAGHHDHGGTTTSGGEHEHYWYRTDRELREVEGAWQGRLWCHGSDRVGTTTWGGGAHGHSIYVYGAGSHNHTVTCTGDIPSHNHTITSSSATTGNTQAFNIEPRYLTCNYYIRVR